MDTDNKIRLFMGRDVLFYSEKIKQPTVGEIIDIGWEKFFGEICIPYMVNFEYAQIDEVYVKKKNLKIFDLFWFTDLKIGTKTLLDVLMESISFIFSGENIKCDMKTHTIVINKLIINRDNFEEFASLCREIFHIRPYKKEKEDEIEIPKHLKKRYERYKQNQAKNNKSNSLEILKTMNYIVHTQHALNYSSLLNLTIFQFFNTQETYTVKEYYDNNLKSVFAGADAKKIDLTHWMNKLKISKQ